MEAATIAGLEVLDSEDMYQNTKSVIRCKRLLDGKILRMNYNRIQQQKGLVAPKRSQAEATEEFAKCGYTMIGEYVRSSDPVLVRCKCGAETPMFLGNCRRGKGGCANCYIAGKPKNKFENIVATLEDKGIKLLSTEKDYLNNATKLKYICTCGKEAKASWKQLQSGELCTECARERTVKIWLEKYGVDNPSKHPAIIDKIMRENAAVRYSYKQYICPSGKMLEVQGYEPYALDLLLQSVPESDIIVMPEAIDYWHPVYDRSARYYPDIYIAKNDKYPDGLFIEVKSTWTITLDYPTISAKAHAAADIAPTQIWVFAEGGKLIERRMFFKASDIVLVYKE